MLSLCICQWLNGGAILQFVETAKPIKSNVADSNRSVKVMMDELIGLTGAVPGLVIILHEAKYEKQRKLRNK